MHAFHAPHCPIMPGVEFLQATQVPHATKRYTSSCGHVTRHKNNPRYHLQAKQQQETDAAIMKDDAAHRINIVVLYFGSFLFLGIKG